VDVDTAYAPAEVLDAHPLVVAARTVADEVLTPNAAQVDAGTVPRSHLEALGRAGLLGLAAPRRLGGVEAPRPVVRRVVEVLAGADLATWFVQAQHHGPVREIAASGRFDHLVRRLATGGVVAGIAFSHLRRWPDRPVEATRTVTGWRFDGVAPWYTGWGLNDILLLSGVQADGEVVHAVVDARAQPGLAPGPRMRVAALDAAATVTLELDGLLVSDEAVASVQRIEEWTAQDARVTVNVNAAVFGVIESALELLTAKGERRGEPAATQAAARIGEQARELREIAYRLVDDVDPDEAVQERLRVRARAHELMMSATSALVISGAGASMALDDPAQRKAREALFLLVQAQTRQARVAALQEWGR
jgi:alkylation response protein AidB-like acyl-CoA dehydrogenase